MGGVLGLMTDFGLRDPYVGVMKAVALGITPGATIVDLSHDIPPQDIEAGVWTLGVAWRYFPAGSVLVAVVDPGVGGARRAIAFAAAERFFVGPDNGLFTSVLARAEVERCVALTNPAYHLPGGSATFHGRDVFAPCAAHLLAGVELGALGPEIDPASLARLAIPLVATWDGDTLVGRIAHVDRFGNLITDIPLDTPFVAPTLRIEVAGRVIEDFVTHFAAAVARKPFAIRDSSGMLAIAVRDGSAAETLGARRGDTVRARGVPRA